MTKSKKKRCNTDKVRERKEKKSNNINLFEVKLNKKKHHVLGKKVQKSETGLPGVSRQRAHKKREESLLVELKRSRSANKLRDRRLGEFDSTLTPEDRLIKRLALDRMRSASTEQFLQEGDDVTLTHKGQSVLDIEKHDAPLDSDEFSDDDGGKLGAEHVATEHFGGGENQRFKSQKERMDEVIAKSKLQRSERKMERDKVIAMTEQLDEQWKELNLLISTEDEKSKSQLLKKSAGREEIPMDTFDETLRKLQFERRVNAGDRTKTEEEIAKERKDHLEELEADRLQRMKGAITRKVVSHSVDDLDDGFDIKKNSVATLSYTGSKANFVRGDASSSSEEDNSDASEEWSDADEGTPVQDGEDEEDRESNKGCEEVEDEYVSASDADEENDSYADVLSSEDEVTMPKVSSDTLNGSQERLCNKERVSMKDEAKRAAKELPYTFSAPGSLSELRLLFRGRSLEELSVVLQRVRACHHPSLAEDNKAKMATLFDLLLELALAKAYAEPPELEQISVFVPHLFALMQQNPMSTASFSLKMLRRKVDEWRRLRQLQSCSGMNGMQDSFGGDRGVYPPLDTLVFLKLLSILFPSSDFRHEIITPAFTFVCQLLVESSVFFLRDVACGLFLCTLLLEYIKLSRRLVPEALNFLCSLFSSVAYSNNLFSDCRIAPQYVVSPFRLIGSGSDVFKFSNWKSSLSASVEKLRVSQCLPLSQAVHLENDNFRLNCIHASLQLTKEFLNLYLSEDGQTNCKDLVLPFTGWASDVMFISFQLPLGLLETSQFLPDVMKREISTLLSRMKMLKENAEFKWLSFPKRTHAIVSQLDPVIEDKFDDRKGKHGSSREANQRKRLLHKYKREKKGAVRELRRDATFLARHELSKRLESDAERKRKVKQLMADLSNQEGSFKEIKKRKTYG